MAHFFKINSESLKRQYAVYVVIIEANDKTELYIGKTGDNREGCNPIISRCGNHFSYNKIHSQVRNKIKKHESNQYTYVFEHFGVYSESLIIRKKQIAQINEMERWLNTEIQKISTSKHIVINPYKGTGYVKPEEKKYRSSFRTAENEATIMDIVKTVVQIIKS